jgi:transcription-repair coupling factor (superfamily II helicase)
VTLQGKYVRFSPVDLPDSAKVRLDRVYPKSIVKPGVRTMLVPRPSTAVVGGQPIRDEALLTWAREVIDTVVDRAPAGARASS